MERLAVDIPEAAHVLSVSPHTIRRYVRNNSIACIRIGRRVLIPISELERLVDAAQFTASIGTTAQ